MKGRRTLWILKKLMRSTNKKRTKIIRLKKSISIVRLVKRTILYLFMFQSALVAKANLDIHTKTILSQAPPHAPPAAQPNSRKFLILSELVIGWRSGLLVKQLSHSLSVRIAGINGRRYYYSPASHDAGRYNMLCVSLFRFSFCCFIKRI